MNKPNSPCISQSHPDLQLSLRHETKPHTLTLAINPNLLFYLSLESKFHLYFSNNPTSLHFSESQIQNICLSLCHESKHCSSNSTLALNANIRVYSSQKSKSHLHFIKKKPKYPHFSRSQIQITVLLVMSPNLAPFFTIAIKPNLQFYFSQTSKFQHYFSNKSKYLRFSQSQMKTMSLP